MSLLGSLFYDANSSLSRAHRQELRYSYEVLVSEPDLPRWIDSIPLNELRRGIGHENRVMSLASGILPGNLSALLAIPDSVRNQPYFRKWIAEVGIDVEKDSLYSAFTVLKKHFQAKFRPTLSRKNASSDTFRSFLENEREGHCEYFATAAALHLRALGIPSRIVLGYRGGTFNEVSRVLEVRELNAHAWVEAYFPPAGWITFDPTPFMQSRVESGFALYASIYVNAVKFWFDRYVVNYNMQAQRDLFQTLASMKREGPGIPNVIPMNLKTLESACVVIVLGLYIMRIRRKRSRAARLRQVPEYYETFLRKLTLNGWKRKPGETYANYHARLAQVGIHPDFLAALDAALETDLYTPRRTAESQYRDLKKQITTWKPSRRGPDRDLDAA